VEEILRIPMREMIPAEFRDQLDAYLEQIERTGEARGLLTVMTRSGERRIWEYHNTLRTEGVASPIVRGIAHDVTEQRETEKRMRELSEHLLSRVRENERTIGEMKLFRTLVDQCNDAIEVVDPETLRFLDANEKAYAELGYSREELLSLRVFDINAAVTEASAAKIIEELRRSGSFVMESVHRRKDGSTFPVEVSLRRVRLERDYVVAVARDLTERKRAEEALRKSEDKFSKAFRQSPMVFTLSSIRDHRYIDVNETFERLTGWRRDEVIGRTALDLGLWTRDERVDLAKLLLSEGSVRNVEARFRMRDGSIRIGLSTAEVIELNGEPCMLAVTADITERKLAEEALRTSEGRQHKIAKQLETERARLIEAQAAAKVGSWEAELPSLEITWSEQTHRIFETDPSHFHPRRPDFVEFIHPEDRAKVDAAFQASLDKGSASNVEYRIVMADGRVKVLEEQWRVFYDERARPIRLMGTCRDVTEQKQAEEALRRSEENYRMFISQSSEAIFREDMDAPVSVDLPEDELIHHILYDSYMAECNDAMARMYGMTSSQEFVHAARHLCRRDARNSRQGPSPRR
jgi:PAS domain S-box-containing protein